jgi:hypothetical protein
MVRQKSACAEEHGEKISIPDLCFYPVEAEETAEDIVIMLMYNVCLIPRIVTAARLTDMSINCFFVA